MCIFKWIGQQILIVWDFICLVWNWFDDNSGQIQIIIAVVALIYAWKAYRKVLHQIDISNQQTAISIDQMDKLNNERMFELRLRLKTRIGEYSKALGQLSEACNAFSSRLQALTIDIEKNNPESLEVILLFEVTQRDYILAKGWDFISEQRPKVNNFLNNITKTRDISFMEGVLEEIEQDQIKYDSICSEIRNADKFIDQLWIPLNSADMYEAIRRMNNFN